jgi:hypothetical protein
MKSLRRTIFASLDEYVLFIGIFPIEFLVKRLHKFETIVLSVPSEIPDTLVALNYIQEDSDHTFD